MMLLLDEYSSIIKINVKKMFGLAWPEILLIAVVAIVAIGPKDIPPLMRQAGKLARKARLMAADFQKHWDDLPAQVDMFDMQKQADELQRKTFEKFNVKIDVPPAHADHDDDTQMINENKKKPPTVDDKPAL
jgi:sec-independent protein translocase protein TatB